MALAMPDITSPQSNLETRELVGPDLEWEKLDLSLDEASQNDNLPTIACFEEDDDDQDNIGSSNGSGSGGGGGGSGQSKRLSAGLKIYSRQPVMFHSRTKKKQAKARTIYRDKHGRYMEIGQSLIIPEDYQGWFEVVPSDFSRSKCFLSIEEVATAMPKRFFTRSHIRALRVEGEGETQKFLERKISPGSILETKGRFKAKLKTKAQTGLFKKKNVEWTMEEVCYLKCLDTDQLEIMIPFKHKGKFNAVYDHSKISQNAVYAISDIMTDLDLPVKVRLLFGKAPVVPCIFTGMLVLRSISIDEVVIGSTILNTRNVLFEIPMGTRVKVKTNSDDEVFKEKASYKDAQKLCQKYSKLFNAMIKLSPDLDTDQKVILHMPSDPKLMEQTDEALRALDLVTDINLDNEPRDHFFNSSDSGSASSEDQSAILKSGVLTEVEEFRNPGSQTHV